MKFNLYKAALLAALGLALSPAAKAADLYVGFNDLAGSAGNDYVIDLAPYTDFTTTSTYTGTIDPSLFTEAFGSDANALDNVGVGAVAGGAFSGGSYLMATGSPSAPSSVKWSGAKNDASSIPTGVYGAAGSASSPTWDYLVSQGPTTLDSSGNGVASDIGNPESSLDNGDVTLTLWESTLATGLGHSPTAFTELGTLTIDANSASADPSDPTADTITFNGINAVPEPSTYGLFGVGGLLALGLRRKLSAKVA